MDILASQLPKDVSSPGVEERYRPRFHFAPKRNWMNDPNGLVYFAGEYHLFFQYNPFGDQWGHMSWGHAVSRDLVHWEELPVAIPETQGEMIFSGSIVVDRDNVSGLGRGDEPPFLAFYTGFNAEADIQRQCLAISHDRGRSFAFYDGNPLIDLGMAHFRDPKVFYHAPSVAWVMAVALPREHKVQFYRSTNLLDWALAGSFGPAGATSGQWECPDLMQVPLETDPTSTRWVLKVDVDAGFVGGGSGAQYFIGDFDGSNFALDVAAGSLDGETVDFGPDFYAAVTWSDLPADQPAPVWVGWMSNHQTGRLYPTEPWRGAQSLPRTLFLFEEAGKLKLGQRPAASVSALFDRGASKATARGAVSEGSFPETFRARLGMNMRGPAPEVFELVDRGKALVTMRYDPAGGLVFHRNEQREGAAASFAFESAAPYSVGDETAIELFLDGCLLDIFIDGGRRVFTCCVFPEDPGAVEIRISPDLTRTSPT